MSHAGLYILGSTVVLVTFLTPVVMVVWWIFGRSAIKRAIHRAAARS